MSVPFPPSGGANYRILRSISQRTVSPDRRRRRDTNCGLRDAERRDEKQNRPCEGGLTNKKHSYKEGSSMKNSSNTIKALINQLSSQRREK